MSSTVGWQNVYRQTSIQAGDTVANNAAATVFASAWPMPANFLTVGRVLRISAQGVYSSLVAAAGNLTIDLMAGTTVLGTTGAQALVVNLTNDGWEATGNVVCITTGAGGTVEAQGKSMLETALTTAAIELMQNTATVALDTTVSQTIGVRVTFSVANASNSIQQRLLLIDIGGAQ